MEEIKWFSSLSDTTLKSKTKSGLIEIIRVLEHHAQQIMDDQRAEIKDLQRRLVNTEFPTIEMSYAKIIEGMFNEHRKAVTEQVLFNVLVRFYFADWSRECEYSTMTGAEVVRKVMETCKKIEKQYNYDFDSEFFGGPDCE